MKVKPECVSCVEKQALNTLSYCCANHQTIEAVLSDVREHLVDIDWNQTPADLSNVAYCTVERYLPGDPFAEAKRKQNRVALEYYPYLKKLVEMSKDRLRTAIRIAATGNVIDLGIGIQADVREEVGRLMETPFPIDDTEALREKLSVPRKILYVGDNAGEIVFDRVLVEELVSGHEVTFVVRGGHVINDAILDDACMVGMTEVVPVITTGCNRIGAPWAHVSDEFRRHYAAAELVISKGQANFETFSELDDKDIFFILRAKCAVIAHELGVSHLDLIMKHQAGSQ
jgi:damage-control phosphatase, subfamily I